MRRSLVVLVLAVVLAGCNGGSAPTPSPEPGAEPERYEDQFNIVPPGSREVNFRMDEGASVHVELHASYNVSWDLHSHNGSQVVNWQEGQGLDATIDFVAPAADTYSVWIRAASPITTSVRYAMTGAFEIVE